MDSPFAIKDKATEIARKYRTEDNTNRDEVDNRYDAMRHIGGALMLYQQYPETVADMLLDGNEWKDKVLAPLYGEDYESSESVADYHNNAIAKKIKENFDEEFFKEMTPEQIMEFARDYVDSFVTTEEVDYGDFDIDPDLIPMYRFKDTL